MAYELKVVKKGETSIKDLRCDMEKFQDITI